MKRNTRHRRAVVVSDRLGEMAADLIITSSICTISRDRSRHNQRCRTARTRDMPKEKTLKRATRDRRQGKSASTQAGEFVREEIDEIRAGKHGARSAKQAIAIGLSKARRAGVKLPPPKKGSVSAATRRKAAQDSAKGKSPRKPVSRTRSRAATKALQREKTSTASKSALSRRARTAARRRTPAQRSASAKKAARTRARRR